MKTYPTRADIQAVEVFEVTPGIRIWNEAHGWCLRTVGGMYLNEDAGKIVTLYHWQITAFDLDDEVTIDCLRDQLGDPDVSLDVDRFNLRRFF
jgi:hypothetical protein